MFKKIVSLQKASSGSLYVKAFIYGNGDNGRVINDFSAEAILNCLTDEGIMQLASGKIPDASLWKTPEQIQAIPDERVDNIGKVTMPLPRECYLCDNEGKPRIGANSRPIVVNSIDVTTIWDVNLVMQRDPVTHLPMLNPYNGGQFVYAPEVDANGIEVRIYRKGWSAQERVDSMFKAGMLKPTGNAVTATTPTTATPPTPAAPDPMAAARAAAMATLTGGGTPAAAPASTPDPGLTVPMGTPAAAPGAPTM